MKKAFKTEISLSNEQSQKFHQSIGVCRWVYNQYIAKNKEQYELYVEGKTEKKFLSANDFDKYINNEVKVLEGFSWIDECGSKARKKAIVNAEASFKRFFKGLSKYPRFKKKKDEDIKLYFPKNNKGDWTVERHRLKVPTFGWVKVKEFGYIPTEGKVISGTVSQKAGRYYVSLLMEVENRRLIPPQTEGVGIDLGIKDFAVISDGKVFPNVNKTVRMKKLKKKLRREQRRLSRKYESLKARAKKSETKASQQNIRKQVRKIQRLHRTITNIRTDHVNKTVSSIIERNPSSITMEDLNVRGMMRNRHLSRAVAGQSFCEFQVKLKGKCRANNIEHRVVDRWYPSSKICSCCGSYHETLKLSDRTYRCNYCDLVMDRDLNASINLKNAKEYKIS
ncbi:MAG: RNA-guided endonuclease InsQ/TnpB family protein [Lysinibacillus sp.]